jgi:predicted nucleotidyltransferase
VDDERAVERLRAARPDLVAVYRYGSTVDGTAGPGSDVDYALLARAPLAEGERFELSVELGAALRSEVDLVDLRRAPTVLQMQIVGRGRLLFEGDRAEPERFEDYVLARYARINEERRGILERIHAEGSVSGR